MDDGKRMASNWEVILTPFLIYDSVNSFSEGRALVKQTGRYFYIDYWGQKLNCIESCD